VRCWPGCFTGGAAVEVGGGVVAHGRRLQAAVLLFKRRRERDFFLFLFPSPLVFFVFFFLCFVYPWLSLCPLYFVFKTKTSLPGFKLPLTLSFLSLFHFSLWLVLSSLRFVLFFAVLLSAGKTVAAGGDDEVLCSWWCCCGWEEDGELSSMAGSVLLLFSSSAWRCRFLFFFQ